MSNDDKHLWRIGIWCAASSKQQATPKEENLETRLPPAWRIFNLSLLP